MSTMSTTLWISEEVEKSARKTMNDTLASEDYEASGDTYSKCRGLMDWIVNRGSNSSTAIAEPQLEVRYAKVVCECLIEAHQQHHHDIHPNLRIRLALIEKRIAKSSSPLATLGQARRDVP